MTYEIGTCEDERARSLYGPSWSIHSTFDPSDSLVEWFVGSPPLQTYVGVDPIHRMANCSQMEPIPYSLMSPLYSIRDLHVDRTMTGKKMKECG